MFGKKDPPTLSQERVMKLLEGVSDPLLEKNLIELGMVKDARIDADRVRVGIELPTPAWEPRDLLEQEIRRALSGQIGDRKVDLAFSSQVRASRPLASGPGQNLVPGARNIVLFASGKGGVGKSTVASNVAAALAQMGANVGLLDADIYGPSILTMFGTSEPPTIANDRLRPVHRHGLYLMSIGFVVKPEEAMTWRGPMLNGALIQFLRDVDWGDLDYLILDLPPGTGDVQLTLAQNVKVSGAALVSTPQDVALADVIRAKTMFDKVDIPVLGVIENMSAFECPSCHQVHHIFAHGGASKLADKLGIPVLGEVPIELGVRESGDQGKPEVLVRPESAAAKAFFHIARNIATDLAVKAAKAEASGRIAGRLKIVQ
jgi:ATP-binding protein involved in chromosome partitioning